MSVATSSRPQLKPRRNKLATVLLAGALGCVAATGTFRPAPAAAAEIQPAPKAVSDAIEIVGRGVASKADQRLKTEVRKYARENMFLVTGDLKPSGEVAYVRGGICRRDGRTGVALEFQVHARAKVDVGGSFTTTKVWAVDTTQVVAVTVLPKFKDDGSIIAEVSAEIISATAKKERKAHQREADGFRDAVSQAIREQLSQFTGEHDLSDFIKNR